MILIHGSSGISAATDRWAQELNSVGVAAFILDAFTGRGLISTNTDQSQLDSIAMIHDVYAALGKLATHPRIDPAQPYSLGDACVEKGPHVGYNEAAHTATVEAVKQFLTSRFKLASK